jgi:hypothetical protein
VDEADAGRKKTYLHGDVERLGELASLGEALCLTNGRPHLGLPVAGGSPVLALGAGTPRGRHGVCYLESGQQPWRRRLFTSKGGGLTAEINEEIYFFF